MRQYTLDYLVIGAQKCATSWMYYCLKEHPELQVPNDKREFAYLGGPTFREQGEQWYFDRYNPKKECAIRGEVAVDCMLDLESSINVEPYMPNPKFIAILRNPVERMVSAYYWCVRVGQLPNLPLNEALERFTHDEIGFPVRRENRFWDELVRRGFYAQQLRPYLNRYGSGCMLVILYDEIKSDSLQSLSKVYRFLGVDPDFRPESLNEKPKANSYNPFLLKLQNLLPFARRPVAKVMDLLNQNLAKEGSDAPLDPELRMKILERFMPHIDETQSLLGDLVEENRPKDCDIKSAWK